MMLNSGPRFVLAAALLIGIGPHYLRGQSPLDNQLSSPINNPLPSNAYGSRAASGRLHTGVDLQSSDHTIRAAAFGEVYDIVRNDDGCSNTCPASAGLCRDHGLGNTIILEHTPIDGGEPFFTLYAHANSDVFAAGLRKGQCVAKGTPLGRMGASGYGQEDYWITCVQNANPHLHFEVKESGTLADPVTGRYYGYTPGDPDSFGYLNPSAFLDQPNVRVRDGTAEDFRLADGSAPEHPAGTLIRRRTSGTVYLIRADRTIIGIPSQERLQDLYSNGGFGIEHLVVVSEEEFGRYQNTGEVANAQLPANGRRRPDGTLILSEVTGEVSIVTDGGRRRPFSSSSVFTGLGYSFCNVVEVAASEYAEYDFNPETDTPVNGEPAGGVRSQDPSPADPFTALVKDAMSADADASATPIILIHGIHGNQAPDHSDHISYLNRSYWDRLLTLLGRDAVRTKYKVYRFHYVSDMFSVWELGRSLRNKIDQLTRAGDLPDGPFIIISHSMGGLVARSYMNQHTHNYGVFSGRRGGERVSELITLATPHHGSPGALEESRDDLATSFFWREALEEASELFWRSNGDADSDPVAFDEPNREDLLWDNFDLQFDSSNPDLNDRLMDLNLEERYGWKTTAYYGFIHPDDPVRLAVEDAVGASTAGLDVVKLKVLESDFLESETLSLALASILMDYGMQRVYRVNDGLVPASSGSGAGLGFERIECSGYNHLEMRDGGFGDCSDGRSLYRSLASRLAVAESELPQISASGVVNAASYQGGPIAPGEIVTIFGSGIGPPSLQTLQIGSQGLVATRLADTQVFFAGVASPMVYTLDGQVSAVVPYSVADYVTVGVQIEYEGQRSNSVAVPVADSAPGIFTIDSSGTGQGAVLNQGSSVNSTADPALPGTIISIYATGEGETDPPGVDGAIVDGIYPSPRLPVAVRIGGKNAEVLYAGSAPTAVAGVLQVNARVPMDVVPGQAVPVLLDIGGRNSQSGVTIAVAGLPGALQLYGIDSGEDDGSSTLVRIDSVTGAATVIGETGFAPVTDIAFTPDGALYGIYRQSIFFGFGENNTLLSIDPITGKGTRIGELGVERTTSLVSDDNGQLYAATGAGTLITINRTTGAATVIGELGAGTGASGDLSFAADGRLLVTLIGDPFDLLAAVDARTGVATVIGSIGYQDVFGLASMPDGRLVGAADGDQETPLLIEIDPVTGRGRKIAEIRTTDGMYGLSIGPATTLSGRPDLRIVSFRAPTRGTIGEQISGADALVINDGDADASPFRIGFYVSTDSTVNTADVYTSWRCIVEDGLRIGSTFRCSGEIGIPANLAPGQYYLGVIADDLQQVKESNEANNSSPSDDGPITLDSPAMPDLVVTELRLPTSGTIGGTVAGMTATLRNQGAADASAFRLGFYISTDAQITVSDLYTNWRCLFEEGLASGSTTTCSGSVGIPSVLAPGSYYLGAIVDDLNQVSESNESNNSRSADTGRILLTP